MINLNEERLAKVRTPYGYTDQFLYGVGRLTQGNPISPHEYGDWTEMKFRWLEHEAIGFKIKKVKRPSFTTHLPDSLLIPPQGFVDDGTLIVGAKHAVRAANLIDHFLGRYGTKLAPSPKSSICYALYKSKGPPPETFVYERGTLDISPRTKILGFILDPQDFWGIHEKTVIEMIAERGRIIESMHISTGLKRNLVYSDLLGIFNYSAD